MQGFLKIFTDACGRTCVEENIKSCAAYPVKQLEASYFDFTGKSLLKLASEAAKLGIEMFVLDDGWFGKRDSELRGLGDWKVNEEKLGCTLGELIGKINDMGLKFGIWIEPEMVNEDSDLYREHPDWPLSYRDAGQIGPDISLSLISREKKW